VQQDVKTAVNNHEKYITIPSDPSEPKLVLDLLPQTNYYLRMFVEHKPSPLKMELALKKG
jgi:hypothetical protein